MDTISEVLTYLKRQAELRATLDEPGAVHVTEERELLAIDRQLDQYPQARRAVVQAAHALRRPIAELKPDEVKSWVNPERVD